VWEIVKGSRTITTLASFNGSNGAHPESAVTVDAAGNIYGTTVYGGANGVGTVWEIVKGSNAITTLASFDGSDGAYPSGGVTLDAAGNLYGTAGGGSNGDGTVWTYSVPEPPSLELYLVGVGVAGAAIARRRRRP